MSQTLQRALRCEKRATVRLGTLLIHGVVFEKILKDIHSNLDDIRVHQHNTDKQKKKYSNDRYHDSECSQ